MQKNYFLYLKFRVIKMQLIIFLTRSHVKLLWKDSLSKNMIFLFFLEPDPALSELKLNNQQSFMTFSSLENTSEIEESYSPTQSPSKPTPIASPIPDEIIDLVSPVPSPEEIPLPDLPPLPSSPVQPMPPPPSVPPTEPEPGFFSSSLAFDIPPPPPPSLPAPQLRSFSPLPRPIPAVLRDIDEPLPPGEDKLPSAVKNTQFMNQSSEVDAESRFFQSQDFAPAPILFPTSVWGFTAVDPNYGLQAERPSYALETETRNYFQTSYEFAPTLNIETLSSEQTSSISKKRRERRKRKISKHENSIVIKRRRSSGDKEDDENELRAILLAQVSKKQESHQIISSDVSLTMSKESITGKEKEETKSVASLQNSLKKSKRVQIPLSENTQTVVNSVSGLSLEPEKPKSAPILPQLKPQQPLKTKQSALSKLNSTSLVKSKLKTVVKPKTIDSRSALKKKGISKADQKKHFPNLTKTLVIPLNNESESDDDPPPPSNPPESFQLDVEKFLLDIRQTSGSSRKPNPRSSTSTITSRSISVQLKAKAKQLTPAAKKQLITSKISNLPLSKQLEYIKLKTLIARKEMMKQKAKSSSAPQTGGKPIPPLVVAAGNVTDDKKEKLDPKQNMKNKKEMIKMIEMKKKVKAKPTSNVKAEVKLSIEKEMKLNTAIQSTDELKKSTDPVNHPDSKSPEPQELEDEDEKLLRESLLKDLKFKKSSNSAEPSNGLASQNISKGKLTVQLSGNKRNVSVGEISNPTAKLAASNLASSKTTTKPTPTRSATSRPASSKPTSSKSASPKPASTKTAISNPTTTKPASSHPSTSKPAISHPSTTMSASFKPISIKPVGSKPTDSKTVSSNPSNSKPTISKPASVNPSNFKSSTYKPSSPNPSSSKPLLTPSSSKPVSKSSTAPSKVSIPSSVTVKSFLPNPSTSSNLPPSASNTSLTDPSPTEPKVSTNIHLNPGAKPAEKTVPKLIPKPGVDLKLKDELKQTEKSVIMNRNDLSNVLYKLSAQMSQLQRQSIELEGAVSYAAELRNQLRETEQLVKLREEKVENLREVIRNSHQEVTLYKEQMLSAEDTCKRLGDEVYGSEYILPPQGAQNIRDKSNSFLNFISFFLNLLKSFYFKIFIQNYGIWL